MKTCATAEQLEGFVSQRLRDSELDFVASHVEECAVCQHVLEGISCGSVANGRSSASINGVTEVSHLLEILKARGPCGAVSQRLFAGERSELGTADSDTGSACPRSGSFHVASPSFPVIDGFRIIREVGRGGMGVVYEAEQTQLSRRVALKVLPASLFPDVKQVQRFEREAAAAARLHHTNIVPVFGSGCQAGHHYFIMQYIEGRGIDAVLRELRREPSSLPPADCLSQITNGDRFAYRSLARIGHEVALALDHAHREGVLHRDIKPSNLLLDAKGHVWVADFGLAKTLDGDDLTSTDDVLGTLRYMAPERFAGRCDARSDLYSLGLTLYEMAALRPAYDAPDRFELIERMRHDMPAALRKFDPRVPRDLETIINKLIACESEKRYASAAVLADDLRRFLDDQPIRARRATPAERAVRWCRRNRWAAAFLVALSLGAVASTWQAFRARAAERTARLAETASREERYQAERSRDRALGAVNKLLEVASHDSRGEEPRLERESLITASLAEAQALVRDLESAPGTEAQRLVAYTALAAAQIDSGQTATALAAARKAVSLAEELVAREPSSTKFRRDLATALHKFSSLGVTDECLTAARRSNEVCRELAAQAPETWRTDLLWLIAMNSYHIGVYGCGKGQFPSAIESFLEVASRCQQLIALGGHTSNTRYLAAMNQLHLCRLYASVNQPDRALAAAHEAVAITQVLVADYPKRFEYSERLHLAYEELATCYIGAQKTADAIKSFESAHETLKQMAANDGHVLRRMARIQALLAQTDQNLCGVYDSDPVRYADRRRSVAMEAFGIADKLSLFQPLAGNLRLIYATQCIDRAEYQEDDGATPDLEALSKGEHLGEAACRELPTGRRARVALVMVRRKLADVLAARGDDQEASEWRRRSLAPARGDANLFYEVAAAYGRQTRLVGRRPTKLTPLLINTRRERLMNNALAMLQEAAAEGFTDGARVRKDTAFASMSARPQFQAILADMQFPSNGFAGP